MLFTSNQKDSVSLFFNLNEDFFFFNGAATFADWMTFPDLNWLRGHSLTQNYFHPPHSHGDQISTLRRYCEVSTSKPVFLYAQADVKCM